jgi:hypothetical protein
MKSAATTGPAVAGTSGVGDANCVGIGLGVGDAAARRVGCGVTVDVTVALAVPSGVGGL